MSTPNPITSEEQIDLSIASTPQDIAKVPGLLNDIASLGSSHDLSIDRGARLALLEKARSLVTALETPRETMLKHTGAETASFVSIALGIDIGLFKEMAKNGGSAKPAPELAKALGINVEVLRRILRHLTAMKHINQTGADEYAPTNFALSLTHPFIADGYLIYRDVAIPPMLHFHAWLAKNSYSAPSNATESPFSFGHKTSSSMFEYMAARPAFQTQFNNLMQGSTRCVEIVGRIKEAMKPGYSRLLVNEHVIPAVEASWEVTYLDMYMMVVFGAAERTKGEWRALLEDKCGLRVVKVWNPESGVEGIIECEVPVADL